MYVDGWMLFAIYFIAILALAASGYALWSLEEVRLHYKKYYNQKIKMYEFPTETKTTKKSHWG